MLLWVEGVIMTGAAENRVVALIDYFGEIVGKGESSFGNGEEVKYGNVIQVYDDDFRFEEYGDATITDDADCISLAKNWFDIVK